MNWNDFTYLDRNQENLQKLENCYFPLDLPMSIWFSKNGLTFYQIPFLLGVFVKKPEGHFLGIVLKKI